MSKTYQEHALAALHKTEVLNLSVRNNELKIKSKEEDTMKKIALDSKHFCLLF